MSWNIWCGPACFGEVFRPEKMLLRRSLLQRPMVRSPLYRPLLQKLIGYYPFSGSMLRGLIASSIWYFLHGIFLQRLRARSFLSRSLLRGLKATPIRSLLRRRLASGLVATSIRYFLQRSLLRRLIIRFSVGALLRGLIASVSLCYPRDEVRWERGRQEFTSFHAKSWFPEAQKDENKILGLRKHLECHMPYQCPHSKIAKEICAY